MAGSKRFSQTSLDVARAMRRAHISNVDRAGYMFYVPKKWLRDEGHLSPEFDFSCPLAKQSFVEPDAIPWNNGSESHPIESRLREDANIENMQWPLSRKVILPLATNRKLFVCSRSDSYSDSGLTMLPTVSVDSREECSIDLSGPARKDSLTAVNFGSPMPKVDTPSPMIRSDLKMKCSSDECSGASQSSRGVYSDESASIFGVPVEGGAYHECSHKDFFAAHHQVEFYDASWS